MSNDAAGFKAAAAGFREYDIPFWLAVTLLEHGELTGDPALLDEARGIFEELKATPRLERLDRTGRRALQQPAERAQLAPRSTTGSRGAISD